MPNRKKSQFLNFTENPKIRIFGPSNELSLSLHPVFCFTEKWDTYIEKLQKIRLLLANK